MPQEDAAVAPTERQPLQLSRCCFWLAPGCSVPLEKSTASLSAVSCFKPGESFGPNERKSVSLISMAHKTSNTRGWWGGFELTLACTGPWAHAALCRRLLKPNPVIFM